MTSSNASSSFRLEIRPSRGAALAQALLGLLAMASLLMSGLPAPWRPWFALAALLAGLAVAWREVRRPLVRLHWRGDGQLQAGDHPGAPVLDAAAATWRGPLLVLAAGRGRRRRRWVAWPDTLPAAERRRVRLALGRESGTGLVATVAG